MLIIYLLVHKNEIEYIFEHPGFINPYHIRHYNVFIDMSSMIEAYMKMKRLMKDRSIFQVTIDYSKFSNEDIINIIHSICYDGDKLNKIQRVPILSYKKLDKDKISNVANMI